jgi:hypothetical protein
VWEEAVFTYFKNTISSMSEYTEEIMVNVSQDRATTSFWGSCSVKHCPSRLGGRDAAKISAGRENPASSTPYLSKFTVLIQVF